MFKVSLLTGSILFALSFSVQATETYTADVCIVGAGAGGTVAAVSAVEAGLSAVLFEKEGQTGGAGNFMEGSFAVGSKLQKEKGVELTPLESFNAMAAYHHWRVNAPLLKKFIDQTGETIQWVEDHGVKWKEVKSAWKDKKDLTWHIYPSAGALPKAMTEIFLQKGGKLLLNTAGNRLIVDDGKVTGVEGVTSKGEQVFCKAPYVILATGGYNYNTKMVKDVTGIEMVPVGAPGRDGDGINMALKVGAVPDNIGPMMINGAFMPAEGEAICGGPNGELRAVFRQGGLYVDKTGKRFFNEGLTLDWPALGNAISRNDGIMYVVFDDANKKEWATEGKGYLNPCGNYFPRHHVTKNLDKLLKDNEAKGNVFIGNTIEEVALKAGMDPAHLKESADNMTKYAEQGKDDQFGKDPEYLRKVSTPPFYIVKGELNTLASLNGVKVNENLQVLNKDDHPIPGLYAIGHDAGGVYGDSYDLKIGEGTASAFAINSGRMAVKDIVNKKAEAKQQ